MAGSQRSIWISDQKATREPEFHNRIATWLDPDWEFGTAFRAPVGLSAFQIQNKERKLNVTHPKHDRGSVGWYLSLVYVLGRSSQN
jgi:hypothetical protein